MYYDVTNYYWELDEEDDLRKRGIRKEHRPEPIVQMGLFMDDKGLPVTYGLFPGNTNDVLTMRPMMDKLLTGLGNRSYIYVADKGIMSGMNIAQIIMDNKGYVISDSVRKATKEMKNRVLKEDDYETQENDAIKIKSRLVPWEIRIETPEGFNGYDCRWHSKNNLLELNRTVTNADIVNMYRGLWQIECSFKITKSVLKTKPVYVHKEESIEAHFLSFFVSLLILRLLEQKMENRIPIKTIVDSLRKANLTQLTDGNYMNAYCNNVISEIGRSLELELTRKFYSKKDLVAERGKTVKRV